MSGPEEWHWPPRYDESYLPPEGQQYWFPQRETMPEGDREKLILRRIQELMAYAWEKSPFYREKWTEAGVHPSHIRTLEDFEKVPVLRKEELRAEQAAHQPFGRYVCVPDQEVKHVHGTSGTTGRPTAFGISGGDWRAIANAHARVMWSMGLRPSDTVFVGSFFSLYMGAWGALIGAERLGARVFPFGAGVAGQTQRAVNWMLQMKPTAFYGTPSYALRIAEVAEDDGVDPRDFGLHTMFFGGEPGASVPSIRARLEEAYGARVLDTGSMAEVTPWMNLSESVSSGGMLCWQDIVYTEVVSPTSLARVPYGSEGTPVYTTLERTSQPMIRLLSNDLTRWEAPSSACGRTYPVLPRGIYGRIDDMFTIRGENIYPSAVDDIVTGVPGYGGEHRIVISRTGSMDELTVHVEHDASVAASGERGVADWCSGIGDRLRTVLGVSAKVQPVARGSLGRTDFKARRVVDERDLSPASGSATARA
ncbi:MAG: AMP-binding protein [Actinomycetota bacterium]|nr:AMP-binding protein [Actinomycetota bacterium]